MSPSKSPIHSPRLVLGWQVTRKMDPRYWLASEDEATGQKPTAGAQSDEDLVTVPANAMGTHTVLFAQSGSGKSFFLGRIVEEILIRTKARCVILDPNADFRQVFSVKNKILWEKASYDMKRALGELPPEESKGQFEDQWLKVSAVVRTAGHRRAKEEYVPLKVWWPSLAVEFIAGDADPELRNGVYHCHAFVQAIGELVAIKNTARKTTLDVLKESERLLGLGRSIGDFRGTLELEFNASELIRAIIGEMPQKTGLDKMRRAGNRFRVSVQVRRSIKRALAAPKYVSPEAQRFYFGKASEYQAAGILAGEPLARSSNIRLEVIDLPSLRDRDTVLLVVNALLATQWNLAREAWSSALERPPEEDKRVPTFLVVDEAHNLLPADPQSKAAGVLREQFRTIAAEGRKYGLFLILASQRPDKLDSLVLSECENKAIMSLGSASVLDVVRKQLGLDDISQKTLERCLDFEKGRVLLTGRWTPAGPEFAYVAARRTTEGGRNLRDEHWASPATEEQKQQVGGGKGAEAPKTARVTVAPELKESVMAVRKVSTTKRKTTKKKTTEKKPTKKKTSKGITTKTKKSR